MTLVKQNLAAKFTDKAYRDAFVAEQIFSRLPLKIRCLREAQRLTQRQLGDLAGMKQTWVSKLEDPNYGKLTISTLLKVASALDVGLQIDFVPYSKVLSDSVSRTGNAFSVPKFGDDAGMTTTRVEYSVAIANHATSAFSGTEKVIAFPQNVSVTSAAVPSAAQMAPLRAPAVGF